MSGKYRKGTRYKPACRQAGYKVQGTRHKAVPLKAVEDPRAKNQDPKRKKKKIQNDRP